MRAMCVELASTHSLEVGRVWLRCKDKGGAATAVATAAARRRAGQRVGTEGGREGGGGAAYRGGRQGADGTAAAGRAARDGRGGRGSAPEEVVDGLRVILRLLERREVGVRGNLDGLCARQGPRGCMRGVLDKHSGWSGGATDLASAPLGLRELVARLGDEELAAEFVCVAVSLESVTCGSEDSKHN